VNENNENEAKTKFILTVTLTLVETEAIDSLLRKCIIDHWVFDAMTPKYGVPFVWDPFLKLTIY